MNINIFLFLRNKYNDILSNIKSIDDSYDEINDFLNNSKCDNVFLICIKDQKIKMDYTNELKQIKKLINLCNLNIKNMCKHEFIEDDIDINLDTSKKIVYCKICELSYDYCE